MIQWRPEWSLGELLTWVDENRYVPTHLRGTRAQHRIEPPVNKKMVCQVGQRGEHMAPETFRSKKPAREAAWHAISGAGAARARHPGGSECPAGTGDSGVSGSFSQRPECRLPMAYLQRARPDLSDFPPDIREAIEDKGPAFGLMMKELHAACAEHVAFSLSPELAWYLIAHEVAGHIRLNPKRYWGYFTRSVQKST
jgi:hypothetical protein